MIAIVSPLIVIVIALAGSVSLVLASSTNVTKTTWAECIDMYDIFTCAQLEETLYQQSGKTFNHTKPSEAELDAELPSYEENPYYYDCVEDYKEEYDKSESVSRDLCKDLLK